MQLALHHAGATPADVAHVNPHATSTKIGDVVEAHALRAVLGSAADNAIVSATKSMTAHLLGAAGALEAMLTVLALHHRTAPPTINLTTPDPEIEIPVNGATPAKLPAGDLLALSNSFGFGGHNVSLAFATP
jgi:3-oxoacyl-[acyl-carrier-protein] synthase II